MVIEFLVVDLENWKKYHQVNILKNKFFISEFFFRVSILSLSFQQDFTNKNRLEVEKS